MTLPTPKSRIMKRYSTHAQKSQHEMLFTHSKKLYYEAPFYPLREVAECTGPTPKSYTMKTQNGPRDARGRRCLTFICAGSPARSDRRGSGSHDREAQTPLLPIASALDLSNKQHRVEQCFLLILFLLFYLL